VSEIHVVLCENGDMEDWHGASENYTVTGNKGYSLLDAEVGVEGQLATTLEGDDQRGALIT
jgi:hypothetical protein